METVMRDQKVHAHEASTSKKIQGELLISVGWLEQKFWGVLDPNDV